MTLRSITVHVEPSDEDSHYIGYAVALAKHYKAELTGLVLRVEPIIAPMFGAEIPSGFIVAQQEQAEKAALAARAKFEAAVKSSGLEIETREVVGSPARAAELFAAQSRTTDLVVIGQADTEIGNTFQDEVIEAVLFGSGRPLLIVPYVGVRQVLPKHVLIGWDGRAQASRAMHDALPLLKEAEQVSLIVVEEVGKKRPATETPVENAAAQLARHGIKAEISHLPSGDLDVGNAILSRAADLGVDLLVMGGYGHSRMRELVLGGATRGILQTMTVPVFMSH